jgi:hypothetical protein
VEGFDLLEVAMKDIPNPEYREGERKVAEGGKHQKAKAHFGLHSLYRSGSEPETASDRYSQRGDLVHLAIETSSLLEILFVTSLSALEVYVGVTWHHGIGIIGVG